jgi:aminoglycoside/choline kinase family phosphotransferase
MECTTKKKRSHTHTAVGMVRLRLPSIALKFVLSKSSEYHVPFTTLCNRTTIMHPALYACLQTLSIFILDNLGNYTSSIQSRKEVRPLRETSANLLNARLQTNVNRSILSINRKKTQH